MQIIKRRYTLMDDGRDALGTLTMRGVIKRISRVNSSPVYLAADMEQPPESEHPATHVEATQKYEAAYSLGSSFWRGSPAA